MLKAAEKHDFLTRRWLRYVKVLMIGWKICSFVTF